MFNFLGNLNTVGTIDNISTSDDEMPTAPPRSRNYDSGQPSITPRRHLNNKDKSRGKYRQFFVKISFLCFMIYDRAKRVCKVHLFFVASRHSIHFDDTLTNEDIDSNESLSSIESKLLLPNFLHETTTTSIYSETEEKILFLHVV